MDEGRKSNGWDIVDLSKLKNVPKPVAAVLYVLATLLMLTWLLASLWLFSRAAIEVFTGNPEEINKLLLGFGGLAGAPFFLWRIIIASQQNTIAQEAVHTTLLAKAVEQLGATRSIGDRIERNIEVRLGAIYALEKLACDVESLNWPIMEILAAYVRQNTNASELIPQEIQELYRLSLSREHADQSRYSIINRERGLASPSFDVEAALHVIGRARNISNRIRSLNLRNCQLSNFKLHNLNFDNCIFDKSNFETSSLDCCSIQNASFIHCALNSTKFYNCSLTGSCFNEADMSGGSAFYCRIEMADLFSTNLSSFWFANTNASGSSFRNAQFTYTRVSNSLFLGSYFTNVKFDNCHLGKMQLQGANLQGAEFKNLDLSAVCFVDAFLAGADFSTVTEFEPAAIEKAFGDHTTKLPKRFKFPEDSRWTEFGEFEKYTANKDTWRAMSEKWRQLGNSIPPDAIKVKMLGLSLTQPSRTYK